MILILVAQFCVACQPRTEIKGLSSPQTPEGVTPWGHAFGGPYLDIGNSVAIDGQGHSLVGGRVSGDNGFVSFIAKYSPEGVELWRTSLPEDEVLDLAVDGSDHVYGLSATRLSKFSPDGALLWSHPFIGQVRGVSVAIDSSGDVLVLADLFGQGALAGEQVQVNSPSVAVLLIAKWTSEGSPKWSRAIDAGAELRAGEVATDAEGSVVASAIVAGNPTRTEGELTFTEGGLVLKLSPSGEIDWLTSIGKTWDPLGRPIAVDTSGHIWTTSRMPFTCETTHCTQDPIALKVTRLNPSGIAVGERTFTSRIGLVAATGLSSSRDMLWMVGFAAGEVVWSEGKLGPAELSGFVLSLASDLSTVDADSTLFFPAAVVARDARLALAGRVKEKDELFGVPLEGTAGDWDAFVLARGL